MSPCFHVHRFLAPNIPGRIGSGGRWKQFGYPPTVVNRGDVLPVNAAPITRVQPGAELEIEVLSSHFSRRRREGVSLHWLFSGIDTLGAKHPALQRGSAKIPFGHHRVELARKIHLVAPTESMLCTLSLAAVTASGETVAGNFIQHFVTKGPLAEREDRGNTLVLRRRIEDWAISEWSAESIDREAARASGSCYGCGVGFFEWHFTDEAVRHVSRARRIRILCEVSARRNDTQQTGGQAQPTQFEMLINGVPVHRAPLPDHPHDTRGALSYLRGGRGAYGYLMQASIEEDLLQRLAAAAESDGTLRLRCAT